MRGDEFIRGVRKYGRRNGVKVVVLRGVPRGGHVTVICGGRLTQVAMHGSRRGEIPPKTLSKMLANLGIAKDELR